MLELVAQAGHNGLPICRILLRLILVAADHITTPVDAHALDLQRRGVCADGALRMNHRKGRRVCQHRPAYLPVGAQARPRMYAHCRVAHSSCVSTARLIIPRSATTQIWRMANRCRSRSTTGISDLHHSCCPARPRSTGAAPGRRAPRPPPSGAGRADGLSCRAAPGFPHPPPRSKSTSCRRRRDPGS